MPILISIWLVEDLIKIRIVAKQSDLHLCLFMRLWKETSKLESTKQGIERFEYA